MLERTTLPDGIVFYHSPLLARRGVPHAFATRIGGVSPPPFDSMNLGNPGGCAVQDLSRRILENYRLLQGACGCAGRELIYTHQVHGRDVATIRPGAAHDHSVKADALVSDDVNRALSVRVADCVPILLASDDGRIVAAVHAGWRGTVSDVVSAAVVRINEMCADATPKSLVSAIGPCIGFDAFEVGPEVIAEFRRMFDDDGAIFRIDDATTGKGHVDLRHAIRLQLIAAGLDANRIDTTDRCTFRDRDEFFSHRRENGITGRLAALIAARA